MSSPGVAQLRRSSLALVQLLLPHQLRISRCSLASAHLHHSNLLLSAAISTFTGPPPTLSGLLLPLQAAQNTKDLIIRHSSSNCLLPLQASHIKKELIIRHSTSSAAPGSPPPDEEKVNGATGQVKAEVSEYWGIVPKAWQRADGASWPWHCFGPRDTYEANTTIDIKKHYIANKFIDKLAYWTVKTLRVPVDIFFRNKHLSHALLLETVAAVPGMVGGMLLHCRSLRRFEYSGGWIKALLDEAENERMHLMTWFEVVKPNWMERALVLVVQGVFFNSYFLLYVISPRLSHRFVGYLEEEAVRSYTNMLEAIEKKEIGNGPAPLIAIDYWRLPKDATIRDVAKVIRADEAHHRDVNHFAADVYTEKKKLQEAPAPLNYH